MNAEKYCINHPHILNTTKKLNLDESGILLLYQIIIGNEEDTVNLTLGNLKQSILNEGLQTK